MFPTSSIVGWQVESGPTCNSSRVPEYRGLIDHLLVEGPNFLFKVSSHFLAAASLGQRHAAKFILHVCKRSPHHKKMTKGWSSKHHFYPDFSIASCYRKIRFVLNKRALSLQLIPAAKAAAAAKLQSGSIELVWSKLAKTPNGWII